MSVNRVAKIFARIVIYIAIYLSLLATSISACTMIIAEILFMIEPCGGFECFGNGMLAVIFGLILGFCTGSIIFVLLGDYHNRRRNVKQKRKPKRV